MAFQVAPATRVERNELEIEVSNSTMRKITRNSSEVILGAGPHGFACGMLSRCVVVNGKASTIQREE